MQFESFRRTTPSINLSALIDIVFILVIFVVLAANFQRIRDIDVNLPEAAAHSDADTEALVVKLPRDGSIEINGAPVAPASVKKQLESLRDGFESVLLMADGEVALQRAVQILADAQAAGFESVSVATKDQHTAGP